MPAGLAEIFATKRAAIMRRGWPTPPGSSWTQREMKAWLDYWAALERRYGKADLTNQEEGA